MFPPIVLLAYDVTIYITSIAKLYHMLDVMSIVSTRIFPSFLPSVLCIINMTGATLWQAVRSIGEKVIDITVR